MNFVLLFDFDFLHLCFNEILSGEKRGRLCAVQIELYLLWSLVNCLGKSLLLHSARELIDRALVLRELVETLTCP